LQFSLQAASPQTFGYILVNDHLEVDFQAIIKVKKGKVVTVLPLTEHHEGVLGEWRYSSTHSLTSALDGGEWSASRPE
jgi:hypothetical protein